MNTVWLPLDFVATDEHVSFNVELHAAQDGLPDRVIAHHFHADVQGGSQVLQLSLNELAKLPADTLYFLVYASDDPFIAQLFFESARVTGPFALAGEFGGFRPIEAWTATPAFALSFEGADPIPEPGTLLLVGGGLTGLLRRRLVQRVSSC